MNLNEYKLRMITWLLEISEKNEDNLYKDLQNSLSKNEDNIKDLKQIRDALLKEQIRE